MEIIDENIEPIFAQAFFCGSKEGTIKEVLQFDYHDPDCYYKNLEKNSKELNKELTKLSLNMQQFLDEETNYINKQQIFPKVKLIDIGFRGEIDTMPFITWIIEFKGIFKKGLNIYEATTPEEELEYNCRSIWSFIENTRIIKIKTKMYYEIMGNHIIFWANKGQIIGGKEIIRFII
ncbi:MAG: hypothetical protein ACTSPY_08405 [Candidatus Helarchaeota archaeon]